MFMKSEATPRLSSNLTDLFSDSTNEEKLEFVSAMFAAAELIAFHGASLDQAIAALDLPFEYDSYDWRKLGQSIRHIREVNWPKP